ncbi:uncharacterized protein LOC120346951 isoform X1 [Styela clava]
MSTSKIPQNSRVSRPAAPSKLPSRILRPTFTNKSSTSSTNFVNSAKQIERKKEFLKSSESVASLNLKNRTERIITVDCNGNNDNFVPDKFATESETSNKQFTEEISKINVTSSTNYYEACKPTVRTSQSSDSHLISQSTSSVDSVQCTKTDVVGNNNSPTFRSLKPGYFLQKVSALKSSQQKMNVNTEKVPSGMPSKKQSIKLPNRIVHTGNVGSEKGKFGYKSEKSNLPTQMDNNSEITKSLNANATRNKSSSGTSRPLSQTSNLDQDNPDKADNSSIRTNLSRAEKRKKYLEIRCIADGNQKKTDKIPSFGFQKNTTSDKSSDDSTNDSTATMDSHIGRRTYLRKPPLRNVKIARPVTRPKKTPSPIMPRPFGFENRQLPCIPSQQKSENGAVLSNEPHLESCKDENIINNFLNKSNDGDGAAEPVQIPTVSNEYFPDIAVDKESGYSSITSTVYLDTRTDNISEAHPSLLVKSDAGQTWSGVQSNCNENVMMKLSNQQSNSSLNDVLSSVFDDELEADDEKKEQHRYVTYIASKDIITYGEYRLQTEGNYSPEERYGSTEARQIRTSSGSDSDIAPIRDARVSPDCGNASDSSAETVIPNIKSPQPPDVFEQDLGSKQDELKTLPSHNIKIKPELIVNLNEEGDEISFKEDKSPQKNDFHFLTAKLDTVPIFQGQTPESSNRLPDTPSTSSTSKAKKRKTDSLIMSPLIIEEIKKNNEKKVLSSKLESEKKKLFEEDEKDENISGEEDDNLSQLIDLPSLCESALMEDYNSILEDDVTYDALSDNENNFKDDGKPTVTSTVETTVINRLLSQGLNGIVRPDEDPITCEHEPDTVFASFHNSNHDKLNSAMTVKDNHDFDMHSEANHKLVYTEDEIRMFKTELKTLKMSITELYKMLEVEDIQKQRLKRENKHLHTKNQELSQKLKTVSDELAILKFSEKSNKNKEDKETQVEIECHNVSTDTADKEDNSSNKKSQHQSDTSTSPRWFHSEVSDEVESNIKEASDEIRFLKDLRGDFDRRIDDAEQRLNSALELLHR